MPEGINGIGGSVPLPPPSGTPRKKTPDEQGVGEPTRGVQPADELTLSTCARADLEVGQQEIRRHLADHLTEYPDLIAIYLARAPELLASLVPFFSEDLRKQVEALLKKK